MKKCDYCAKEISYYDQYCSEDCHARANRFYEIFERCSGIFSVINGICVFGIPIGIFLACFAKVLGTAIASASAVLLGIMLLFLPFPTESMIKKHKIQKAVKMTRIFGCCVIALGIIIALLFLFIL